MNAIDNTIAHYELLELIGEGAMGDVYKARDSRLDRIVALKFVKVKTTVDGAGQRLMDEARAAAGVNHPYVATIYELGLEAGDLYIAMEYVEGRTLKSRLREGPLAIDEVLACGIQVAEALDCARESGVIHCDVKPANVMLTRVGVKVLDFGLAKLTSAASRYEGVVCPENSAPDDFVDGRPAAVPGRSERDSDTADVAGSLAYMSPEQLRGEALDSRTDVFSLGVVIYEMTAGRRPFEGESRRRIIESLLDREPLPLSAFRDDAPLELERIIRKAIRKNRSDRHASAGELLHDLRNLRSRLNLSLSEPARSLDIEAEPRAEPVNNRVTGLWLARRSLPLVLASGVIVAMIAVADIVLRQPAGAEILIDVALFIVAAICIVLFASQRRAAIASAGLAPASSSAFRGLAPFQEADRNRFFGRETEIAELLDRLLHHDLRLGVLYGDSGSGKTSLVRAGVAPRLWERGFVALYCRSYKDPIAALFDECRRQTQIQVRSGESAVEYLKRVSEETRAGIVVIWDQFEEFFVTFKTRAERSQFLEFIAACQNDERLALKILFSIRSDFLHLIWSEFSHCVSEPLASSRIYHLRKFDEDQAADIIDRCARWANLPLARDLSGLAARDLAAGGAVLPSELQIVGERLQTKRIYTVQAYKRAGGKEQLVHSFLEDVILACGDGEGAKLLLRSLISDENTRLTLPLSEISKRMQKSKDSVKRLLNLFVEARLVREIQDDEPWRYELMHEYLIDKINQITGRVMDATQRANRLMRQYASGYSVDKRTRIPLTRVLFIRRYSDADRGERERELLIKSLRLGLLKAAAAAVLLLFGGVLVAAPLSISEQWETVRLSDGHSAAVLRTVFSPDGRLLISCGEDSKIIVWDFARRQRLATLSDHTGWVNSVAFSPDGKWFVSASDDRTIIVWDTARLNRVVVLSGGLGLVKAAAFSRDGKFLAAADLTDADSHTIVWRVDGWQRVHEMPVGFSWGNLVFSPDNRYVMISNGLVTMDLRTGKQVKGLFGDEWGGNSASLSPDGRGLVSVDGQGLVSFVDFAARKLLSTEQAHRFHGRAAAFSPDGRLAATAAEDIVLWDAATRTKIVRLEHTAEVWSLAFSPDGRWLVSGNADGAILVWDVAEREALANFNAHHGSVRSVAFSPDGKRLATASEDRSVIIWDLESGEKEAVLIGHNTRVTSVAFSPDGKFVASSDQWSKTIYWDLGKHAPLWSHSYRDPRGGGPESSYCVAISPNQRWLAFTRGVYDTTDGHIVLEFMRAPDNSDDDQIYGAAFSPDGRWLASVAPVQHAISIWDTQTWLRRSRVKLEGVFLNCVRFSPDGQELVTGDDQASVRLWRVDPLSEIAVIGRHAGRVKSVDFSADGGQVVSGSEDQTVALWDVKRRKLVARIGTHTSPVLSVAFSPDGNRIASGDHDRSVRIYRRERMLWGRRLD